MKLSLADEITMQGISEYNLRKRVVRLHATDPAKRQKMHPSFRGIPFCNDEGRLSHMNEMAVKAGVPAPFSDMRELSEDNRERFLWSYFEHQKERNKTLGVTVAGTRCVCQNVYQTSSHYHMPWSFWRMMNPRMNRISLA